MPQLQGGLPQNDFWAYYQTAVDEHGFFRRELGDQTLLFNAEHPDPNDPLHKLYVDDGYGLTDKNGQRHRFVAYYNSWVQWANIRRGRRPLAEAYSLTSDRQYADKAAVLLDRIADVYPDMDFAAVEHGFRAFPRRLRTRASSRVHLGSRSRGTCRGRTTSSSTGCRIATPWCSSAPKAQQYQLGDKSSVAAICRHIEDHLLLEMLRSFKDGRIDGNTRHSQPRGDRNRAGP